MLDETGYILDAFQRNFKKNDRICLYGVGKHTWEIIKYLKEYNIVGVADFSYTGKEYCLLRESQVLENCDFIVIIARPMVVKKIYTKIRNCIENIPVYTIEGCNLDEDQKMTDMDGYLEMISRMIQSQQDQQVYNRFCREIKKSLSSEGNLVIGDIYSFANVVIAPFFVNLYIWTMKQAVELKCDLLLLQARDGYILNQLYKEEPINTKKNMPNVQYFYASRNAVTGACSDLIEKENYEQYLRIMNIDSYHRIGIYDFAARGTVQYYLQKLMRRELQGLYYLKLPLEIGSVNVVSYCEKEKNFYQMKTFSQVFYPLMESIVQAPCGSLRKFDCCGNPILEKYVGDKAANEKVIQGIVDYYKEYRSHCEDIFNAEVSHCLIDAFMNMLRMPWVTFLPEVKKQFVLYDSYNKETLDFASDILI